MTTHTIFHVLFTFSFSAERIEITIVEYSIDAPSNYMWDLHFVSN